MSSARLRALVERFAGGTVVVVGDLILDEYVFGRPVRISREAPVVILRFTDRALSMGGAANAAHNVHALGARVIPVGVIGRDAAGDELTQLFRTAGVPTHGIVQEAGRDASRSARHAQVDRTRTAIPIRARLARRRRHTHGQAQEIGLHHVQARRCRERTFELRKQRAPSRERQAIVELADAGATPTGNAVRIPAPRHA